MFYLHLFIAGFLTMGMACAGESDLAKKCMGKNMDACLELTGHFAKASRWKETFALGEALCKQDILKGCTYAGTAAIALGDAKVGFDQLSKACDGFEPYACKSLSDIAKKNREDKMRYMYQKRSCYYGLSESCKDLNKPTNLYSTKGSEFYKKTLGDCEISNSAPCKAQLTNLAQCPDPLTKEDCFFMPGDLSIVFRAKLIQDVAKLILVKILASQKIHREANKRYTYDLSTLVQDKNDLTNSKYVFGFQVSCTKKYESSKAQSTSMGVHPKAYQSFTENTKRTIIAFFKTHKGDDCYDPNVSFESYAVGKLDPLNPTELDVWKINRDGDISQIQNGLP